MKRYALLFILSMFAYAQNIGEVVIGKCAIGTKWTEGENQTPVAIIDSIEPNPADSGLNVYFGGHGTDDGTIDSAYWYSDKDGVIGNDTAFSKNDLTIDTHAVWFKAMDNESVWSDSVLDTLIIETPAAASEGAEWYVGNGYAIGGGPGFPDSFVVTNGNTTTRHYVTDSAQFYNIMNDSLDEHDTIYIADNADINIGTTEWTLAPGYGDPDYITICSGRGRTFDDTISWGGKLRFSRRAGDGDHEPLKFYIDYVLVSSIRIQGPQKHMGDHNSNNAVYGGPHGLRFFNSTGTVVENCEFIDCGNSSMTFGDGCVSCTTRYNYCRRSRGRGDGYHVNVNGDADVVIHANLFDFYRHAVTCDTNSNAQYDASYCIFMEHDVEWQSMDRHAGGEGGYIHHCTWMAWEETCHEVDGFNMLSGVPSESLIIDSCWSYHDDSSETFEISSETNVRISDIHYGRTPPTGLSGRIPTANGQVDTDSGDVPLTVTFQDNGSSDPDGSIAWYEWDLGIGDDRERIRNDSIQYTHPDIGRYIARLYVYDNNGIPDYEETPIQVVPAGTDQDTFWLSFWFLDGYLNTISGDSLEAQCVVENDTVWQQGLNGDSMWQHIVENITSQVASNDSITIEFRLVWKYNANSSWKKFFIYFDDVWMWNGTVVNGDFEAEANGCDANPDGWIAGEVSPSKPDYVQWGQHMGGVVSGKMSMRLNTAESPQADANDYVYVRQKVDVLGQ